MANFNPDIPKENDPVYFHYSRPIEKPDFRVGQPAPTQTPQSSFGAALETAGEVAGITVRGADEAVKNFANQETQDKVRALRDQYAGQLTDTKESLTGTKGQTPVPAGLRDLGGKIDGLINAKDSGKISPTYYYGQAMKLASEVRSHYPVGYREYIDDKFKDVLGVDPANAYIRSVTADINEAAGKVDEEVKHVRNQLDMLNAKGEPNADKAIKRLNATGDVDGARAWINQSQYRHYYSETLKEDVSNAEGKQKLQEMAMEKYQKQNMADKANTFYEQIYGDGPDRINPSNLSALRNASPEEIEGHLAKITQAKNNFERQARMEYNTPSIPIKDQNGKVVGYKRPADVMPQETFNAHLSAAGQQFDNDAAMITNKDFGAALGTHRMAQMLSNEAHLNLLKDKDMGPPALVAKSIRDQYGEGFWANMTMETLKNNYKLTDKFNTYLGLQIAGNVAKGTPQALQKQVEVAGSDGRNSPNYVDGLIDRYRKLVDGALSSNPSDKEAAAKAATVLFGPENMKFIDSVVPDYYDEQGNFHPGAEAVFRKLTDPKVGEAVRALGPEQFKQWQNWSENSFKGIFARTLKDMDTLQRPGLSVSWDNEAHRFGVTEDQNKDINVRIYRGGNPATRRIIQKVNTLNAGLANLSNIAKSANFDINTYLWRTLTDMGADPKGQTIPGKVMKAIEAAHPKQTNKEFFKQ